MLAVVYGPIVPATAALAPHCRFVEPCAQIAETGGTRFCASRTSESSSLPWAPFHHLAQVV